MTSGLLSLTRVSHMFEDMLGESLDSKAANDVSALVSVYVNEELERAFTLPAMSVAFRWPREMLGAVVTFCRYQMDTAGSARRDARGSSELRRHLFHELVEHSFMCLVPRQIARNSWTTVARGRSTGRAGALLVNKLEGGFTKRHHYEKKRRLQARRQDDLVRIHNFPRLDELKRGKISV